MEVQYQKDENDEDEFVMVERVNDSLRVLGLDKVEETDAQLGVEPAVSAKTLYAGKEGMGLSDADGLAHDSHLPVVLVPKLMQTPQNIPPLYPFSRTTVYVLLSPEAAQGTIKSVVLKGSSLENPLEIEVPVETLPERAETIHQLAAKHAVTELEEGRGWLVHAKDEKGLPVMGTYTGRHQSMVEHEAVRLGIQYQIAGKFTSFVATETVAEGPGKTLSRVVGIAEGAEGAEPLLPNIYAYRNQGSLSSALRMGPSSSDRRSGGSALNMTASSALLSSTRSTTHKQKSTGGIISRMRMRPIPTAAGQTSDGEAEDDEAEETGPLQKIIGLQTFEGYWNLDARLVEAVGLPAQYNVPQDVVGKIWATVLAITFLKEKLTSDEEAWVMVVEKAQGWLEDTEEGKEGNLEENWTLAKQLIMGAD